MSLANVYLSTASHQPATLAVGVAWLLCCAIQQSLTSDPGLSTPAAANSIAFGRTTSQVLKIVYLGGTSKGGFYPNGVSIFLANFLFAMNVLSAPQSSCLPLVKLQLYWNTFSVLTLHFHV